MKNASNARRLTWKLLLAAAEAKGYRVEAGPMGSTYIYRTKREGILRMEDGTMIPLNVDLSITKGMSLKDAAAELELKV